MNFPLAYAQYQFCDVCTHPLRNDDASKFECAGCGLIVHYHCITWSADPTERADSVGVCDACWRETDED